MPISKGDIREKASLHVVQMYISKPCESEQSAGCWGKDELQSARHLSSRTGTLPAACILQACAKPKLAISSVLEKWPLAFVVETA